MNTPTGLGEEADIEQVLRAYSGAIGPVAFALPGPPQKIRDRDNPGYWRDSIQLFGSAPGGEEYQLRTADIGEWIARQLKEQPEGNEAYARAEALLNYAFFIPAAIEAEMVGQPEADLSEGLLRVRFHYGYPDTPGGSYRCEAVLWEDTATLLMGEVCDELELAFQRLRLLGDDEREALANQQPVSVTLEPLRLLFPREPGSQRMEGDIVSFSCLSEDLSLISAQHIPSGVELEREDPALPEQLHDLAERVMLPAVLAETIYEPSLTFPEEDTACYGFRTISTDPFGEEYGQHFLCRMYLSERGVVFVWTAEGESGQDFLDHIEVLPPEKKDLFTGDRVQ